MGKKLHVGNLTYSVTSSDLQGWFTPFGTVQSAQVIQDRDTGRSKGFGFVEMDTDAQAQAAIQGLHDQDHDGRRLTVDEAKPRVARTNRHCPGRIQAVAVSGIDRPPSRWVSWGSLVWPLDPSGGDDAVGSPPPWPLACRPCESEESESVIQTGPEQAERVLCYPAVHS